jgi:hypothetical protein
MKIASISVALLAGSQSPSGHRKPQLNPQDGQRPLQSVGRRGEHNIRRPGNPRV